MGFSKKKKKKRSSLSKKRKGLRFLSMSDFLFWQKQTDFSNLASKKPIWQPCNVHGLILFTKISKKTSVTSQYPS